MEQISFKLDSAGSFNIDYFYDKISNSGVSSAQRENIWHMKLLIIYHQQELITGKNGRIYTK